MENDLPQGSQIGGTGEQSQGGQVPSDSLASGFLSNVPEEDRNVVEKYVKDWDAGVTRKFQEIHDSYKGYKDLGTVDEIKTWQQVADAIQNDPRGVADLIAKELNLTISEARQVVQEAQQQQQTQTPPVGNQSKTPANFQGLPPEFVQQFEQQQKLLEQLARTVISSSTAQREAEEEKQLDSYLSDLRSKKGDFDEEWVLLKMYNGMDGEKAVDEYHKLIGGSRPIASAPPPLSGGGIVGTQQNVKDMDRKQTQELVAGILSSVNKE